MTRARYRAFKCRQGVHRPKFLSCRDCGAKTSRTISDGELFASINAALEKTMPRFAGEWATFGPASADQVFTVHAHHVTYPAMHLRNHGVKILSA
jgi:hypothetical protein